MKVLVAGAVPPGPEAVTVVAPGLSPGHIAGGQPGITFDELPTAFGC